MTNEPPNPHDAQRVAQNLAPAQDEALLEKLVNLALSAFSLPEFTVQLRALVPSLSTST